MKLLLSTLFPAVLLCGVLCGQGPLAPPAAPASTQKSLQQIEPRIDLQATVVAPGVTSDPTDHYIISQAGSYYLSNNLNVTKTTGIEINASNVSLDLNGFTITAGNGTVTNCIFIATPGSGCLISNGKLNGAGFLSAFGMQTAPDNNYAPTEGMLRGISVSGCGTGLSLGGNWSLEDCRINGNPHNGVLGFHNLTLLNCDLSNNGSVAFPGSESTAFECKGLCVVTGCTCNGNGGPGFLAKSGSFTNCSANSNSTGFFANQNLVATNCTASSNLAGGIVCNGSGTFSGCQATGNGGFGFFCADASVITNCVAADNHNSGFELAGQSSVTACNAKSNGLDGNQPGFSGEGLCTFTNCFSTTNYGDGFRIQNNCAAIGCTASQNGLPPGLTPTPGNGINAYAYVTVKNCTVVGNNANGILAASGCVLTGNNVSANCHADTIGTAGIHLTGSTNTVDGNTIDDNVVDGIHAEADRNFIARNNARNNGNNYVIVTGNRVAEILVPTQNTIAIPSGNNGDGNGFTVTDPWANFSY